MFPKINLKIGKLYRNKKLKNCFIWTSSEKSFFVENSFSCEEKHIFLIIAKEENDMGIWILRTQNLEFVNYAYLEYICRL